MRTVERPRAWAHLRRFAWVPVPAFVLVAAIFVGLRLLSVNPWLHRVYDMWAYWTTRFGLDYAGAVPGETGDYIYSPAFAQLLTPLTALPWPVFAAAWTVILAVSLWWLTGRAALLIALLPPVALSVAIGQVDVLMAAAVVVGLRWPAAWAFPILTKVTPGIGLLWFAARREWQSLGIALGATVTIVAVSALVAPEAWLGWLAMLLRMDFPSSPVLTYLPIPVWIRLPAMAALVVWGARTDRAWVLPVAACLSLPTVFLNSPTVFVALLPLLAIGARTPAGAWLRSPASEPAVVGQRVGTAVTGLLATSRLQAEAAMRSVRRNGLRWATSIRRRVGVDRRWSGRTSGVDR